MKKPLVVAMAGLSLVLIMYFAFPTSTAKEVVPVAKPVVREFQIKHFIDSAKDHLTASQSVYLSSLENSITRGDVQSQQVTAYERIASFWKDSVKLYEPYAHYMAEAAKLDNSEKNLTFAARIFLDNLRWETHEAKLNWETSEAIQLYEKALALNPENDDLRIGLGSSYIFGKGRTGNPDDAMKGIQELLSVVRKDSTNMKAQLVLGMGGFISGQYDRALERLQKVVNAEPNNLEAIAFLADTYAAKGDKANAIKWYTTSKRLANNPHYTKEVDERIRILK